MTPTATSEPWDVVVVPFPFAERPGAKRRPALVVSRPALAPSGHIVLAMITTTGHRPWPGDTPIRNLSAAGLPRASMVRMKLFTIDRRLIRRIVGRLDPVDRRGVTGALREMVV